jgi:hypothetical protein
MKLWLAERVIMRRHQAGVPSWPVCRRGHGFGAPPAAAVFARTSAHRGRRHHRAARSAGGGRVAALAAAGFHDIGVSPLRSSRLAYQVLRSQDWPVYISEMIRAAEVEWQRLERGAAWRFSNLATVVKQIHAGAARTLPCGAGDNYVSVDAHGEYFGCHRTLGDERFHVGAQPHDARYREFLAARQVDHQEPCRCRTPTLPDHHRLLRRFPRSSTESTAGLMVAIG